MDSLMIKVENISKKYKLGQIGGMTLRDELQRKWARARKKEDPLKKIGEKDYEIGETFLALEDINFEVKKGERVGIIGHNGAGKSTLLKLLSRVTAPSTGVINLDGRVASMLEVGTGFHGELTGRENIYMNGAILGMSKKEIDKKIEDIIEFSEVRQFIDTPVKRYSSGMFVKLAFSVAAHLDAEIMIMDEVLAVGDVAFQTKCLNKMNDVSRNDGRTILYVSHNMNTVRQLCQRCIVLDHGHIIFDGSVEEGIAMYIKSDQEASTHFNLEEAPRSSVRKGVVLKVTSLGIRFNKAFASLRIRMEIFYFDGTQIGIYESETFSVDSEGERSYNMSFVPDILPVGKYYMIIDIYELDGLNRHRSQDHPTQRFYFEIFEDDPCGIRWEHEDMGHVRMGRLNISE